MRQEEGPLCLGLTPITQTIALGDEYGIIFYCRGLSSRTTTEVEFPWNRT